MTWPTPQDYNEALQNPRLNFEDADLKAGTPDLTPLGLPRPITGGFASVYSVRSASKRWAVRCFLREFSDHRERYAEIGRHLAAARLPYMVHFQFVEKGIRVRAQWYPILKMEWIEGATFHEAIETHINNPEALRDLAERWVKMLASLKKNNIAHGDLQHGNILIKDGEFRLIDYDGMFVPSLAGRESHEVGHRNYQHPSRVETDFGAHLDNFSGWVIYFTLMALSIEPGLWNRYGNSQEHLLFQRDDFDEPRYSRVFRSLRHMKDDRIQKHLPLFESFLGMRLQSVASPADVIGTRFRKRQPWQASLPAWFSHQLSIFTTPEVARPVEVAPLPAPSIPEPPAPVQLAMTAVLSPVPDAPSVLPTPVESFPERPAFRPPVTFVRSVLAERLLVLAYALFMATLGTLAARGTLQLREMVSLLMLGLGCVSLSLICSFLLSDEVRAKLRLRVGLASLRLRAIVIGYAFTGLDRWKARIDSDESRKLQRIADRNTEAMRIERTRITAIQQSLSSRESGFRARGRARWRILKLRRARRRTTDQLAIESADVRFRFKWWKDFLQRLFNRSEDRLGQVRKDVSEDLAEIARYDDIRLSKYLRRILGFR
jgi:serine/threonine protein kinase